MKFSLINKILLIVRLVERSLRRAQSTFSWWNPNRELIDHIEWRVLTRPELIFDFVPKSNNDLYYCKKTDHSQ